MTDEEDAALAAFVDLVAYAEEINHMLHDLQKMREEIHQPGVVSVEDAVIMRLNRAHWNTYAPLTLHNLKELRDKIIEQRET